MAEWTVDLPPGTFYHHVSVEGGRVQLGNVYDEIHKHHYPTSNEDIGDLTKEIRKLRGQISGRSEWL
jgi:hypothetical protein